MFNQLSNKFSLTFKKLRGHSKLTEKNIEDGLKEVRLALLEADVNYGVVKKFVASVKEKALGSDVLKNLNPTQQLIKIVNDELTKLMGDSHQSLKLTGEKPQVIMLVGLQGSGKTTTAAKLANILKKKGENVYLVPADTYRPAAIEQLKKVGAKVNVPVFDSNPKNSPIEICKKAQKKTKESNVDVLLIDTAGRLHIDEDLMKELETIKEEVSPCEILFVADAMTGQDAVNVAASFNERLDFTGLVLTKMDGDARGGAALSIKAVTGKPLKFIGVGEKLDELEVFHPDRMASRILGMGDTLTLIEKAQESIDKKEAEELEKKLKKSQFTLDDFRKQLVSIKKMGSLSNIINMIPGFPKTGQLKNASLDDKELVKIEAIINSMTYQERRNYNIIKASRKQRIAKGSGTKVQDVNRLLKNYAQMLKMIKKLNTNNGMKQIQQMMRGNFSPF